MGDRLFLTVIKLGHKLDGRALEASLIFVKMCYGFIFLLTPEEFLNFKLIEYLPWEPVYNSIAFFLSGVPLIVGWHLEKRDLALSRKMRVFGAFIGLIIWLYILIQGVRLGLFTSWIGPWAPVGCFASIWIIIRASLDEPITIVRLKV